MSKRGTRKSLSSAPGGPLRARCPLARSFVSGFGRSASWLEDLNIVILRYRTYGLKAWYRGPGLGTFGQSQQRLRVHSTRLHLRYSALGGQRRMPAVDEVGKIDEV